MELKEKVKKILDSGFLPLRQWPTSHDSILLEFVNENGGAAIDIHSGGRFTVMRFQNGKNEIFGTNDIDEAIKELLKSPLDKL